VREDPVAAYIIGNIEVTSPEPYASYVSHVGASVAQYGGRFIVRGGRAEKLEGPLEPRRVVVIEFPTVERAKAWWESEEYRELKSLRRSASTGSLFVVEGA
jgi:uncharacterized protein (DUF1330 family)